MVKDLPLEPSCLLVSHGNDLLQNSTSCRQTVQYPVSHPCWESSDEQDRHPAVRHSRDVGVPQRRRKGSHYTAYVMRWVYLRVEPGRDHYCLICLQRALSDLPVPLRRSVRGGSDESEGRHGSIGIPRSDLVRDQGLHPGEEAGIPCTSAHRGVRRVAEVHRTWSRAKQPRGRGQRSLSASISPASRVHRIWTRLYWRTKMRRKCRLPWRGEVLRQVVGHTSTV
eukprot:1195330-Prorocentrum_minimum.AAC.2